MRAPLLWMLCAAALLGGCSHPDARVAEAVQAQAGERAQFPADKHGELVYQGYRIFTQTPTAARTFAGNGLRCSNCHLEAGNKADSAPLWGAYGMYPAYQAKSDRVISLEERMQQCFVYSMNGLPPPLDSREIAALSAYAQWVARGRAVGVEQPGRGFPTLTRAAVDPNPQSGKQVYAQRCAMCHGAHGEGRETADGSFGIPPLWGFQSFNKGAGMNRIDLLAGFVKANMPLGNADLSDQEAFDVAAWIQVQERWPDPRKGLVAGFLER